MELCREAVSGAENDESGTPVAIPLLTGRVGQVPVAGAGPAEELSTGAGSPPGGVQVLAETPLGIDPALESPDTPAAEAGSGPIAITPSP